MKPIDEMSQHLQQGTKKETPMPMRVDPSPETPTESCTVPNKVSPIMKKQQLTYVLRHIW